jgi:prepilin-type N-terminal cleavage/methylation domain-containing protein
MKIAHTHHFSPCGFTLVELMLVIVILGIMAVFGIPGVSAWLPDHRLKRAAGDVYSNMQLARMNAIKANADWAIVFVAGTNRYLICSDEGPDGSWSATADNVIEKTASLPDYGSGVGYGHGNATTNATSGGGPFPGDDVSYNNNVAVFNPRGTGSAGYVYLDNNKNTTTYGVGTRSSGIIRLLRWYNSTADWQ